MSRRLDWDALRGLFLVLMTLNHVPTVLEPYVQEPLGFVTNAEFFVFLSAFLAGFVFTRKLEKDGARPLLGKVLGRARTVYFYHIGSVMVVLGLSWIGLGQLQGFRNNTWFFLEHPWEGALAALTLVWQPAILDILPLYVIMLLLTGPVLLAARRWGWWPVMAGSVMIWFLALPVPGSEAWPVFHLKPKLLGLVGLEPPLVFGVFNDFSWQLLWISALMCGSIAYHRRGEPLRVPIWVVLPAALVALAGFVLKHPQFGVSLDLGQWWWVLGKWNLGPLRLLNLACLIVLYMAVARHLVWLGQVTPLVRLGQNSIGVFTLHAVLVLPAVAVIQAYDLSDATRVALVAGILLVMYGWTYLQPALLATWQRLPEVRQARLKPLASAPPVAPANNSRSDAAETVAKSPTPR